MPTFGGTVTASDTVPLAHGTVAGSPGIAGFEEKVQLAALVTTAESVTNPPADDADRRGREGSDGGFWRLC